MRLAPRAARPALGASHAAAPRATQSRKRCAAGCPAAPRSGPGHHPGSQCLSLGRHLGKQVRVLPGGAEGRAGAAGEPRSQHPPNFRMPNGSSPGCGDRGRRECVAWRPDLEAAAGGGGAALGVGRPRRADGPRCARASVRRAPWRQTRAGRGGGWGSRSGSLPFRIESLVETESLLN